MYSTTGIVIKKQNKGENDQVLPLFTKDFGKVDFLCRGIRKGSAKLTGHLGLFNLSNINFVLGKQFKVITTAVEIESFIKLKKNSSKISAASHIMGLVDQYTISEETDGDIFHLGLGALDYLNRKEMKTLELKFFLRYFEFKFLSLLGYEPEDKTIIKAFTDSQVSLTENDLNKIEEDFSKYFRNIYSKV